jgi:hypothetical protein
MLGERAQGLKPERDHCKLIIDQALVGQFDITAPSLLPLLPLLPQLVAMARIVVLYKEWTTVGAIYYVNHADQKRAG